MSSIPLEFSETKLTRLAADWIAGAIGQGAIAIDATVGNGYDTLFLAHAVGPSGHVIGFDVQKAALKNASELLRFTGMIDRVRLVLGCHSGIEDYLRNGRPVQVAMFNLGYLPRGDRSIVTRAPTTLAAIDGLLRHLSSSGRVTILSYRGHTGGPEEYEAVKRYLDSPREDLLVREVASQFDSETTPRLFLLEKRNVGNAVNAASAENEERGG
jgi:methylase of polypeptide subunit release factors